MSGVNDIDVVIRTCGERTTGLLVHDVNRLLPNSKIHIVEERPHFNAVLETFVYAKRSSAQFTLALDADLILKDSAPEVLISGISKYDLVNDVRLNFMVKDKFVGIRDAANHLYNNNFSQQLYDYFVKHAEQNTSRPESDNLLKFSKLHDLTSHKRYLGKRSPQKNIIRFLGNHGYEQSFTHVYKSMFNCGVKYRHDKESIMKGLVSLQNEYPVDFDYKIALEGFLSGTESGEIISDSKNYPDITELLNRFKITEKPPLVLS